MSGAALLGGLAGCSSSESESTPQSTPTATASPTATPTETETETPTETATEEPETRFDQDEFDQMYQTWLSNSIEEWNGRRLIRDMANDEGPRELGNYTYPGYADEFSKEEMLASDQPKESMPWPATATRLWLTDQTNSGAISTENDCFIAILQQTYDELHPRLDIHGGFITLEGYGDNDNGGHGVSFFHDDTHENWYCIDTTRSEIFRLDNEERHNNGFTPGGYWRKDHKGVWNPLTGWQKGEIDLDGLRYEEKMTSASKVVTLAPPANLESLTNRWVAENALDAIYNHIWEGGAKKEITSPMQKMAFHLEADPDQYVGIYEDAEGELVVAYGDSTVHNEVMETPGARSAEWFEENTERIPTHR